MDHAGYTRARKAVWRRLWPALPSARGATGDDDEDGSSEVSTPSTETDEGDDDEETPQVWL